MFYYFYKALVIKKRQGLALPFLQLTTYETQSPSQYGAERSLLHPEPGNRYSKYTKMVGFVQKNCIFLIFLINDGYRRLIFFI